MTANNARDLRLYMYIGLLYPMHSAMIQLHIAYVHRLRAGQRKLSREATEHSENLSVECWAYSYQNWPVTPALTVFCHKHWMHTHTHTHMCACMGNRRPRHILGRSTYRTCWGTYHGFFFFLSFLFRPLISERAERNSTKIGHMVGSKCNLKTRVQNLGYPLPLQIECSKPLIGRLRNLTTTV